jgi:hypothetical protein
MDDWSAVVSIPGAPSYYDASVSTATAGYCVMRSTSDMLQETWEFSLGTAGLPSQGTGALPFRVQCSGPGQLSVSFLSIDEGALFRLVNASGQLVASRTMRAGETMELSVPEGLYFALLNERDGTAFAARTIVE